MPILDTYRAVITAEDRTAPGVRQAQRTIGDGLKKTGAGASGAEAEKAGGAWTRLNRALAATPGNLKVLYHSGGLGRAVDQLKEGRRAVDDMGVALRNFVPATAGLAALGTAAGIGEMLRDFGRYGVALKNTAGPLATSTQDLERWQMAGERAGVSAGAVASAFGQLNQKILGAGYGSDGGAVALFNYFGIAARNADGSLRKVVDLIPEVFRQFKANSDPRIQHQILEGFGLGDLDPLFRRAKNLAELMDALREKEPLTAAQVERADALNKSFTGLEQSVGQFSRSVSSELQPTFGPMLDGMAKWLDANRENEKVMGAVKIGAEAVAAVVGFTMVTALGRLIKALFVFNGAWLKSPFGIAGAAVGLLTSNGFGQFMPMDTSTPEGAAAYRRQTGVPWNAPGRWPDGRYLYKNFLRRPGSATPSIYSPGGAVGNIGGIAMPLDTGLSGRELAINNFGGLRRPGIIAGPVGGGFQSFATPAQGVQASAALLLRYQDKYHLDTIRGILNRWAPASDNGGDAGFARLLSGATSRTGFGADQPLNLHDAATLSAMTNAMIRGEVGEGGPSRNLIDRTIDGFANSSTPAPDFASAVADRDSHHSVEVSFVNAPPGMRSGLTAGQGPADFNLRVEHGLATQ